jgi:hypothetical protein
MTKSMTDPQGMTMFVDLPWGDLGPRIQDVRDILGFAMLITQDAFALWEDELADKSYSSEFDVPVEHAVTMVTDHRLAHVARLIRSLSMAYGIRTDFALGPEEVLDHIGEVQPDSPAWILATVDHAFAHPSMPKSK